jgi:hypothetical protein
VRSGPFTLQYSINKQPYYYDISAEERPSSPLSTLLGISEANLVDVFEICGFYNKKRSAFLSTDFQHWLAASFDSGTVEVTSFKKTTLIKIAKGIDPTKPASQKGEPPRFRMRNTPVAKSSRDSLLKLLSFSIDSTVYCKRKQKQKST